MRNIVAIFCVLLTGAVQGGECLQQCEETYSNALLGCQYMQQSCIRRYHREDDMEFCMEQNIKCVDRAQEQRSACKQLCAETSCATTCESTGMYDMSQWRAPFGGRCYEIIDCAIRTWDDQAKQCLVSRHEERRMLIACYHIPPA